jgi:3-oxoadipate enol-lactonase
MGQVITRKVQLGDVELAIAEAGIGGRPLLLLHGFTGAKEDFTDWVDALAALGWHAVAPDHRGHGDSSKPAGVEAYSTSILAADSTALVDALGWDRYTLLGHSMGGFVAQRMAFANPARILGLVLMDTGHGPVDGIDPDQVTLAVTIAVESGMDTLADLMAEIDSPLETAAHRRLVEVRPGYAQFEDRKFRATSPYLYASVAQELISCTDSLTSLSGMDPQPPTLVLVGEQDAPFRESAQRMAGVLRNATLAVIPDAGHSPQFENPDAWWQTVSSFLESISKPVRGGRNP